MEICVFLRTADGYQCMLMYLFEVFICRLKNQNDQLVYRIIRFLLLPEKPLFLFLSD